MVRDIGHRYLQVIAEDTKREDGNSQTVASKVRVSTSQLGKNLVTVLYHEKFGEILDLSRERSGRLGEAILPARATMFQKIGLKRIDPREM